MVVLNVCPGIAGRLTPPREHGAANSSILGGNKISLSGEHPMSGQPTVADYIVRRLAREGITDCGGVAGYFAFKLCDAVARSEAKNLTPVVLELGGKSPTIVHSSADLRVAARRIAQGRWNNAGQTCTAPDYVLVFKDVAKP